MFPKTFVSTFFFAMLILTPAVLADELLPPTFGEYQLDQKSPSETELSREEMRTVNDKAILTQQTNTDTNILKQVLALPMESRETLANFKNLPEKHRPTLEVIQNKMRTIETAQNALANTNGDGIITQAKELRVNLKALQLEIQTLKNRLGHTDDATKIGNESATAGAPSVNSFENSNTEEAQTLNDLTQIDEELAYREALIERLLTTLEKQNPNPSTLGASLLALNEYPFASGLITSALIFTAWLFRGRIAELSGFGVRIVLNKKTSTRKRK